MRFLRVFRDLKRVAVRVTPHVAAGRVAPRFVVIRSDIFLSAVKERVFRLYRLFHEAYN